MTAPHITYSYADWSLARRWADDVTRRRRPADDVLAAARVILAMPEPDVTTLATYDPDTLRRYVGGPVVVKPSGQRGWYVGPHNNDAVRVLVNDFKRAGLVFPAAHDVVIDPDGEPLIIPGLNS